MGGICGVLLCAALFFYFGGSRGEKAVAPPGHPVVKVHMVQRADMMRRIVLSGQTVADAEIALAPKYTGRIAAVYAELGDRVQAGDVLMVQDTGDLDISILQNEAATEAAAADAVESAATYEANYLRARTSFELLRSKYERNQYLYSIGAISQDTLDTIRQEFLTAQAAFEILENQAASGAAASVQSKQYLAEKNRYATQALKKQREDLILRAPRAGIIGFRAAEEGAMATAGTKVFSLVDTSHVYVDCALAESDAAILVPGQEVMVTVDALGSDYPGRIIYVSPSMGETAKTYTARIALAGEQPGMEIKAGLFAHAQLDILQRPQTLFVPKEAVFYHNGQSMVFVCLPDGTAESRKVRLGLLNDSEQELLSGVADGELVILTNQDKLEDGKMVERAEVP